MTRGRNKKSTGVSIVEIILVVAIMALLAVSSFSFGSSFLFRNNLANATNETISSLRTAQLNALSSKEDKSWGVEITSTQVIVYAVGDTSFNQIFTIPGGVVVEPLGTIVFSKLSGNPASGLTITLSNNLGDQNTVVVNEVGVVDVD